jgi:epsilon-lactone hydrolase
LIIFLFLALVVVTAAAWLVTQLHLRGDSLARYDGYVGTRFASDRPETAAMAGALARLAKANAGLERLKGSERRAVARAQFDALFADRVVNAVITPVARDGVKGEWVVAPGADSARRMLYIHGGGFVTGSPLSHRNLTVRFSELIGGAVLALDYRLMPEHPRMAGVADARNAYCWMLANGPHGSEAADVVFVGGDSAGANLTLSLLAWVRDQGLRAADAAFVLSPPTDGTLSSPSLRANIASDYMLGPVFARIARMPQALVLWMLWLSTRLHPRDPVVSPIHGDLSNLPPLLVHASETEMLIDDARRYVSRAREAGSPVTLQTWNNTLHVWHIFNPEFPEALEALAEIGKFLAAAAPARARQRVVVEA